jgi:autotransporter-associated beta strand protein
MKSPARTSSVAKLLVTLASLGTASAQTTWDAGGGVDTNINTAANWNNNVLPANNGTVTGTFSAGSVATFNVDYYLREVILNRTVPLALNSSGGGRLVLPSLDSTASTYGITVSSGATGAPTLSINAPIRVNTTATGTNKLLGIRNNSATATLDLNGDIGRTSDSTADFQIRYSGAAGSTTRIDGAIANVTNLQQAGGAWAGTLVVSGNRSLGTTNISAATTGTGVGAITGSLVLGEASTEVQSWGNLTLNNGLKVVVGGDVSFAGFAGAATTSLVGATQAGDAVSKLTLNLASAATIGSTLTLGGAGAGENNLGLVKAGAGDLTLSGVATYTGPTRVEGGVLRLGSAERIGASSRLVLAGGTFDVNGFSETLGALDLDSASFLDLDNASNATGSISFASSAAFDWGSSSLSISATTLGAQSVRFGTSALGLNAGQLANITVNGLGGWGLDTDGYLVSAIPEPSSFAVFAGLAACGLTASRRRRHA